MNKEIMKKAGFGKAVEAVEKGDCGLCNKKVGSFRDSLSEREFKISGLCQACQDIAFGGPPEQKWTPEDLPSLWQN